MKRKNLIQYIFILILFIAFSQFRVSAQQVTARLDTTDILLGDQINLYIEIDKPADMNLQFPFIGDTIAEKIEILERSDIDTVKLEEEAEKLLQSYLITCFDSGTYRLPPFWVYFETEGNSDSTSTNSLYLNVHTMEIDTAYGPTDIKMPYAAPLTLKEVAPYILGSILIGAILFFILYAIKKKKENKPIFSRPEKPKEPAHIIAIRELDRIKEEKLWQKDKVKQFYSEVTETLRVYIKNRFEIEAMEQTSDETIQAFESRKGLLNEKNLNTIAQILKLADMVKFAKYIPLADDNNMTLVDAYFFINETKIEIENKPEPEEDDSEGDEVIIK